MAALYSCTKCNNRYPCEDLSVGQQLCKQCTGKVPLVCRYCCIEFQDFYPLSNLPVCEKCKMNLKLYGEPISCEFCNNLAAFIGSKCQRCDNSQKRYGDPFPCELCQKQSAFDRKGDSRVKVDGKLLCWSCTLSYKRTLAKTKNGSRHFHDITYSSGRPSSESQRSIIHSSDIKMEHLLTKKPRIESTNGSMSSDNMFEYGSSDHMGAIHHLKEEIAVLRKQLLLKDKEMLRREKEAADGKAQQGIVERELRLQIKSMEKNHNAVVEDLQSQNRILQRQVISLKRKNGPQRL